MYLLTYFTYLLYQPCADARTINKLLNLTDNTTVQM